jgi:membrane protease YdiL (CAAX protease family)
MDKPNVAIALMTAGLLVGSATAWGGMMIWGRRRPWLPWYPRRPVPWSAIDLLVGLALLIALGLSSHWVARAIENTVLSKSSSNSRLFQENPAGAGAVPRESAQDQQSVGARPGAEQHVSEIDRQQWRRRLVAEIIARLVWFFLMIALLRFLVHAGRQDLGWEPRLLPYDISLGVIVFLMAAPFIYGLQAILLHYWPKQHPLIELLQQTDDAWIWGLTAISVVVVAPVVEEFAFRVLLQGWMEKVLHLADVLPGPRTITAEGSDTTSGAAAFSAQENRPAKPDAPQKSTTTQVTAETDVGHSSVRALRRGSIAIVCSASVFSVLHADHGPAWIPLFFLGILLGYLYLKTHRVAPCMVLHGMLNGCSFLLLMISQHGAK